MKLVTGTGIQRAIKTGNALAARSSSTPRPMRAAQPIRRRRRRTQRVSPRARWRRGVWRRLRR
ncbi:MAG: hypothetical protein ACO3LM_10325, partial [Steroidobacteraceae bacterium]